MKYIPAFKIKKNIKTIQFYEKYILYCCPLEVLKALDNSNAVQTHF